MSITPSYQLQTSYNLHRFYSFSPKKYESFLCPFKLIFWNAFKDQKSLRQPFQVHWSWFLTNENKNLYVLLYPFICNGLEIKIYDSWPPNLLLTCYIYSHEMAFKSKYLIFNFYILYIVLTSFISFIYNYKSEPN